MNNNDNIIKSRTLSDFIYKHDEEKNINLVLDLDNTIICTHVYNLYDDIIKIKILESFNFKNNNFITKFTIDNKIYFVYIRPYFTYFINTISMYYNIYIYTNSLKNYCDKIIDCLKNKYFNFKIKKVICRNNTNFSYIKKLYNIIDSEYDDLHFMENNNYVDFINKTIIIDDNEEIWTLDKNNVIKIKPYIKKDIFDIDNNLINIEDDTLLLLSHKLFIIYNKYIENINVNLDFNIQNIILKYK